MHLKMEKKGGGWAMNLHLAKQRGPDSCRGRILDESQSIWDLLLSLSSQCWGLWALVESLIFLLCRMWRSQQRLHAGTPSLSLKAQCVSSGPVPSLRQLPQG